MKSTITLIATCLVAIGSVSCNPVPTSAMLSDESLDNMYGKLKSVSLKGSSPSDFDMRVGTPPVGVKTPMHPTKDWNDFSDYKYANAEDDQFDDSENSGIMRDDDIEPSTVTDDQDRETFGFDEDYDGEYSVEDASEEPLILEDNANEARVINFDDIDDSSLQSDLYSIDEGTESRWKD